MFFYSDSYSVHTIYNHSFRHMYRYQQYSLRLDAVGVRNGGFNRNRNNPFGDPQNSKSCGLEQMSIRYYKIKKLILKDFVWSLEYFSPSLKKQHYIALTKILYFPKNVSN